MRRGSRETGAAVLITHENDSVPLEIFLMTLTARRREKLFHSTLSSPEQVFNYCPMQINHEQLLRCKKLQAVAKEGSTS